MLCLVERSFVIECIHLLREECSVRCLYFGLNYTSAVTVVDRLSKMSATNSILSSATKSSLFGVIAFGYWVFVIQSPVAHPTLEEEATTPRRNA
jgi:hypothetical protein